MFTIQIRASKFVICYIYFSEKLRFQQVTIRPYVSLVFPSSNHLEGFTLWPMVHLYFEI